MTFEEDDLARMLDRDTQEPYEEPREWWETPLTFLIALLLIVVIIAIALA